MPQHKIYVSHEKYEQYRRLDDEQRESVNKAAQTAWYRELERLKK